MTYGTNKAARGYELKRYEYCLQSNAHMAVLPGWACSTGRSQQAEASRKGQEEVQASGAVHCASV